MSETADKMPSPGLLAQASSHYVTLSYYIISLRFCQPLFPHISIFFFKKFSTFLLDCRSIFPQSLLAVSTLYTPIHNRCLLEQQFIHTLIRHFINFLCQAFFINFLWYFSPQCDTLKRMYSQDTQ